MSSDNGVSFSEVNLTANTFTAIAYGNGWFVIAVNSTNTVYRSSDNGLTWESVTVANSQNYNSMAFSNDVFVCCASSGTDRVMYSIDNGITWTYINVDSNNWLKVTKNANRFLIGARS